jgi:predicted nucleic acid-binding protein
MIFDTDIFIWVQRGNSKAADLIESSKERYLSVFSYMELLQAAKSKQQHHYAMDFLQPQARNSSSSPSIRENIFGLNLSIRT